MASMETAVAMAFSFPLRAVGRLRAAGGGEGVAMPEATAVLDGRSPLGDFAAQNASFVDVCARRRCGGVSVTLWTPR
jgi:hypothetical protein